MTVCPLETWLTDSIIQRIAIENDLTETTFYILNSSNDGYELRWFTCEGEVDLCGHATLGTAAHAIFTGISSMEKHLRFQTRQAGELIITRNDEDGSYTLDFPSRTVLKTSLPDSLLPALYSHMLSIEVYLARDYMLV